MARQETINVSLRGMNRCTHIDANIIPLVAGAWAALALGHATSDQDSDVCVRYRPS
jgi:hypothetical protein